MSGSGGLTIEDLRTVFAYLVVVGPGPLHPAGPPTPGTMVDVELDGDTAPMIVITMPPTRTAADARTTRRLLFIRGTRSGDNALSSVDVIFDQVTPQWQAFCADTLAFKVPNDFDLMPSST